MKRNLNDDTRYMKKYEEPSGEEKSLWPPVLFFIFLILAAGYFIFFF